jgi:UDP-N-acetylmuramoyl-tripeptide--D-alanyl-D-alanine ligase
MSGGSAPFLTFDEIRDAVAGSWLVRPSNPNGMPCGVTIDSRDEMTGSGPNARAGKAFVAIRGERFDGNAFAADALARGASIAIVEREVGSPPGAGCVLAVADGRRALGDLARAWRERLSSLEVIAVTGSAGKTTTRRLIDGTLAAAWKGSASPKSFNNEIGVPLTLLAARPDDRYVVVEIGMNRPGEILALASIAKPTVAVVTMVGRVHLEGLGSLAAIAREKSSLLESLEASGLAVVNASSEILLDAIARRRVRASRVRRFGTAATSSCDAALVGRRVSGTGQAIEVRDAAGKVTTFELALPGEHNAMNALAAVIVGRELGLGDDQIRAGLASVKPAGMRLEPVDIGEITIFNDAYNANPDAMAASIRAFAELTPGARRRVLVLGDMLELGDAARELHREVGGVAAEVSRQTPIDVVLAVGAFATDTLAGLSSAGWRGHARSFADLDAAALDAVLGTFAAGDAILLKGSRGAAMERVLTSMAGRQRK